MNITKRFTFTVLTLLTLCAIYIPALADGLIINEDSKILKSDLKNWKPQEPRQEFEVTIYAFSAVQTGTVEVGSVDFNKPKKSDTFRINSDPKHFIKQMQEQYPGFEFSVISSGSKVCSNQEPCTFKVAPKPDDPTLTKMTAEFKLNVKPEGDVVLYQDVSLYRVDPYNPIVSEDGKTVMPNEKSQHLFTIRTLKPGQVMVVGGFRNDQDGILGFAISLSPHNAKPQ